MSVVPHNSGTTLTLSINHNWRVLLSGFVEVLTSEEVWDMSDADKILMSQYAFDLLADFYD